MKKVTFEKEEVKVVAMEITGRRLFQAEKQKVRKG